MKWGSQHYSKYSKYLIILNISKYLRVWMPGAHLHLLWGNFFHSHFGMTLFLALLYHLLSCHYRKRAKTGITLVFYLFTLEVHYCTRVEVPWRQGPYWFRSYCVPSSDGVLGGGELGLCLYQRCKIEGMQKSGRNRWWAARGLGPAWVPRPPHLLTRV